MELQLIRFHGFDVNSSKLAIHDSTEGGKFKVKIDGHSVSTDADEHGNWILLEVNPKVSGFDAENADEENPVFELDISLTLSFECGFDEEIPEEFYRENSWFFENFVYLSVKLAVENLLKNTVLDSISLPWSPKL